MEGNIIRNGIYIYEDEKDLLSRTNIYVSVFVKCQIEIKKFSKK
jgi:hypothetical protein